MRTITIEKTLYAFDELSESAKERAREEYSRFIWESGDMHEQMQQIADGILEDAGMTPAEGLTYSLHMQGGHPTFTTTGEIEYDGKTYTFTPNRDYIGDYMLEDRDGEGPDDMGAYDALHDRLHSLAGQMYADMIAEDEYQSADEQLSEVSDANGWEYDEEGNLA